MLNPAGYVANLLLLRAYTRTYKHVETADPDEIDTSQPLVQLVFELQHEALQERNRETD